MMAAPTGALHLEGCRGEQVFTLFCGGRHSRDFENHFPYGGEGNCPTEENSGRPEFGVLKPKGSIGFTGVIE